MFGAAVVVDISSDGTPAGRMRRPPADRRMTRRRSVTVRRHGVRFVTSQSPIVVSVAWIFLLLMAIVLTTCVPVASSSDAWSKDGRGTDSYEEETVNLVSDCLSRQTTPSSPVIVPAADGLSSAFLFDVDRRPAECVVDSTRRVTNFLRRVGDFTIQFSAQQTSNNVGVIFSLGTQRQRFLELESSGWRGELRLHYTSTTDAETSSRLGRLHTEVFDLRDRGLELTDGQWHAVSVGVSADGSYVVVHVDCRRVFSRHVSPPLDLRSALQAAADRAQATGGTDADEESLHLWLGQRNSRESLFKGAIDYVKLSSSSDSYREQCSNADTECPSCSEFHRLQTFLQQLQSSVVQLTSKLALAEQRISELESCECRRKCPGSTPDIWYRDGDVVSAPDSCTQCICRGGSVECVRQPCPELQCAIKVLLEGECCPVCRKHCKADGVRYEHGDTFSPRRCYTCTCQDGKTKCTHQARSTCPRLQCARQDQILVSGECCKTCRGADFCALHGGSCHPNSSCVNLTTRHVCMCKHGFTGNGTHCDDINECETIGGRHGHHCYSNTECVNTVGSYDCRCLPGFEQIDLFSCRDIDECRQPASNGSEPMCDNNAVCVNTPGSYQCICKDGYSGDGRICQPVCDEPCRNGGQCVGVGICRCRHGYMGKRCETDIDECAEGLSTCDKVSTECVNLPGGYYCRCRAGFRPDYISSNSLSPGKRWDRPDGLLRCLDIDECRGWGGGHECPHGTTCRNVPGSYECICTDRVICTAAMSCTTTDGNVYRHGDTWQSPSEQCTNCLCEAGHVACTRQLCDCRSRSPLDDADSCCSHCRTTCQHQQDRDIIYYLGETWQYQCQQCQCLAGGEVDCYPLDCPRLTCSKKIQDEGDCCPRCASHGPCFSDKISQNAASANSGQSGSCVFRGKTVPAYRSWHPDVDPCTMCQCLDGNVCCSYIQNCTDTEDSRQRALSTTVRPPLQHYATTTPIDNTNEDISNENKRHQSYVHDMSSQRQSVNDNGGTPLNSRRHQTDGRSGRAP